MWRMLWKKKAKEKIHMRGGVMGKGMRQPVGRPAL
jgi:hypothetical protein